jgi:predicted phosphodiesterase
MGAWSTRALTAPASELDSASVAGAFWATLSLVPRVVALADTHGFQESLVVPEGDILIHAGDLTRLGSLAEIERAARFFAALPHRHKILIAGNHDFGFQRERAAAVALLRGITYLEDEEITVLGLRIHGSPWQPEFCDWAFNLPRGPALAEKWSRIDHGVDVLVTHGPPRDIGDRTWDGRHEGCDDLKRRIEVVAPRVHLFGHIHEARGAWTFGATRFINCTTSECSEAPAVIDLEPRG